MIPCRMLCTVFLSDIGLSETNIYFYHYTFIKGNLIRFFFFFYPGTLDCKVLLFGEGSSRRQRVKDITLNDKS